MAFWWVNHKQTFRQETDGGYIWSPKANANGARNVSYDNLTRCQRGDVVFSYAKGRISQIGLVETAAVTAPKPPEFGTRGDNWSQEGWLVQVNWQPLRQPLVPQTFFELLQPLLPERHSPVNTTTGRGNQGGVSGWAKWGLLKNISRSRFESSRRTGVKAGRNRGYAVTSDSAVSSGTIFLRATKSQPTG